MRIINVIAPYRIHGTWVFDDPRVGLAQQPVINGADTLIDRAIANILGADRGFFLIFSGLPFPGYVIRLIWRHCDMDGNWYFAEGLGHEAWLCPALLNYFDEVPKTLYLQCKARPQEAKHPSEWPSQARQRVADAHGGDHEPTQPVGSRGAAAHLTVEPDTHLSHFDQSGPRAWLRSAGVLFLFLVVIANLVLGTMGLLGRSGPRGYVILFLLWTMGITGLVMLARLGRAMVPPREQPPRDPPA